MGSPPPTRFYLVGQLTSWEVHLQIFVLTLHIVKVVGVCTDSHVTVRTMLMNSAELKVLHSYRGVGAYIV